MKIEGILGILIINVILFVSIIAVHELGHGATGSIVGCKGQKFSLAGGGLLQPHTEMNCYGVDYSWVYLGGLAATLVFSFVFLFFGSPAKNLFFVSLGLSIVFSSLDMSILARLGSLVYPLAFLGSIVAISGEYLITASYMNNHFPAGTYGAGREIVPVRV